MKHQCRYIYFCTLRKETGCTPAELERARCIKRAGNHVEHITRENLTFDHHCQEPLEFFPHIFNYYYAKSKKEKKEADRILKELFNKREKRRKRKS